MYSKEYNECLEQEHFSFSLINFLHRENISKHFIRLLRKAQFSKISILKWLYDRKCTTFGERYSIEIYPNTKIGKGLYLGHPYGITVNPHAVIGEHVCLHKGVTIGVENRGVGKGTPIIGNCVWIGINSTIFGNIRVGNDVLISPNTVVKFNVPDHSIVCGNPARIKHREFAVEGYISREIYESYFGVKYEEDNNY